MLTRYFLIFLLWAVAAAADARTPLPPVRLILVEPAAEPIQLRHLDIRATINGGMAETTVKMVFYNPNHRQLEGNLQFPLADGQQITAFALDINGVMRPAVPVEKARGRMVFEAIERSRVDPGLLEVTQGNNFKLRVYPIMPKSTRTVELRYAEPLLRRAQDWVYRLPLEYGKVERLDLAIDAGTDEPRVTGTEARLAFERRKSGYQAQLTRTTATGAIEVLTRAYAEPRVYRQEFDNATWFMAEVPVKSVRTRRATPRVIGLLWDSSGSGATRAIDAELGELDRYFTALGNVEVRLTRLRDRPEAQQVFQVVRGDWSALRKALAVTVYDGASALNDWQPQSAVDQYLLFSDGLSNYGGAQFPQLAPHQQLFALNSSLAADAGRLAGLAERNRGQLIQVQDARPGAAAESLLYQDARLEHIAASGAADLEVDSNTIGDGMLRVAGRLLSPQAKLTLTLSNGGKPDTVTVPLSVAGEEHPRAAAMWASFRLRRLDGDFDIHRSEIGRIGRRFSIPTRETSLIVLEELRDYVRYQIEPPAGLMKQYLRYRGEADRRLSGERHKHIEEVVRMFEQRKAWWTQPVQIDYMRAKVLKEQELMELRREIPMVAPKGMVAAAPASAPPPALEMSQQQSDSPRAAVGGSAAKRMAERFPTGDGIGIALQKWVPNAPYMDRLNRAPADKVYQVYQDLKPDYANSSAFFLDAADILLAKGQRDLALRVLSNLSEMDLENRAVLRILGYRLLQVGAPNLAVPVFEHVLRIAVEEPQSFRDLGLALAAAGKPQQAIDTLYEVVLRPWDGRFPEIETITLADLNAIVALTPTPLDVSRIDRRLLANLPLDLRVVLAWDAANSDMDLYVTDPNGERCDFSHNRTSQGGRMSADFTGGYGPEEFSLRRAKPGKYRIEANYYGNRQQIVAGATTLQVKLFTGFGTARQKEQLITLRLKEQSETVFVGEFEVKR